MTTKIPAELSSTPGISDSSNATAITIDSSENVGIGTSSPTGKIHVAGSPPATNGGLVFVRNSDAASNNTTFGGIHFSSSPGTDFSIGKANVNTATTLSFRNGNTGASYMDIDSSGNVDIADGNLSFASGHGIDFSATSDVSGMSSELLDDYEEGVYVATITCSTSGTATLNGAYSDLSYTKIGRLVTVTGLIIVSSVSSPVGYYSINLPFTPTDLTDRAGDSAATIIHHYGNNTGAGQYVCMINEYNAYLLVYRGDVGTTRSENSAEELRAGTQLNISATYVTA